MSVSQWVQYAFWCIFSLKNRTWLQHFFTNALKQLYQQEVPEGPSKIYTDKKNFREDLEFPEGGLRYRNCLNYITLHYITIAPRLYV